MQEGIHPDYPAAAVNCACGNSFVTRSTRGDFQVDVCAACHPFYTGTQKLIDAAGRVDRFRKRYDKTQAAQAGIAATNKAKADAAPKVEAAPKAEPAPKKEKAPKAEAAPKPEVAAESAPEAEKSTEPEQTNTPE